MRLLDRLRNRMAAMEAETHLQPSPEPTSPPLQWDEVTYLDPREERAAMRESYANAVRQAGSRPSVLIVVLVSFSDAGMGATRSQRRIHRQGHSDVGETMRSDNRLTTALKSFDSPIGAGPLQLELAKFYYVGLFSLSHAVPQRHPAEHGGDEAGAAGPREQVAGRAHAGGAE